MLSGQTWIWFKFGDHREEGISLTAKFVSEMGHCAGVDDVNVRVARTPAGKSITVLTADHPWWREQMRVHPNGWNDDPIDAIAARYGVGCGA
jgi:hypothetical protein